MQLTGLPRFTNKVLNPMSPIRFALMLFVALALCCARAAPAQQPAALPGDLVLAVATGESDERAAAIAKLVTAGNAAVQGFFQALIDGDVQVAGGKRVLIIKDGAGTDAATGEKIATLPDGLDEVIVNNRMRGELEAAMDAFKLSSPDRATRLAAIKTLESDASENMLPLIDKALAAEQDAEIKARLLLAQATLKLKSADAAVRLAGVKALATSNNPGTKMVLLGLLEKSGADFAEPDGAAFAHVAAGAAVDRRARKPGIQRLQPGLDPAAGRARPCHHLRADGRHQHGARRNDHDRRLQHLPRAKCFSQLPARRL
jgi:hypothetical protein